MSLLSIQAASSAFMINVQDIKYHNIVAVLQMALMREGSQFAASVSLNGRTERMGKASGQLSSAPQYSHQS